MTEKIMLSCPIKGCGWKMEVPKDTPDTPILEYIAFYHEFKKHVRNAHTIDQITSALYSWAICLIEVK